MQSSLITALFMPLLRHKKSLALIVCVLLVCLDILPLLYYSVSQWLNPPHVLFLCGIVTNLIVLAFAISYIWRTNETKVCMLLAFYVIFSAGVLSLTFPPLLHVPPFFTIETLFLAAFFPFSSLLLKRFSLLTNACFAAFCIMLALMWHLLQTPFTATTAGEILKPEITDVLNFLTFPNVCLITFSLFVAFLLSYMLYKVASHCASKNLFVVALSCFALFLTHQISQPESVCAMPHGGYNFGLRGAVRAVAKGIGYKNKYKALIDSLPPMSNKELSISTLHGGEGCVLIVHLGEALSANHTSLNGYSRNTTPYLSSCKGLINFKDCVSAAPLTANAHIALLTNAQGNCIEAISPELMPTCGSFLEALTNCHFKLYLLETEGAPDLKENEGLSYALGRLHPHADFSYATRNQKLQKENIEKLLRESAQLNTCVCINNDGSHWCYYNYDKETAPFNPADPQAYYRRPDINPVEAEKVVNAYDNTVYDTDRFIAEILQMLEGKPYLYIYISDHGENVSQEDGWVRETDMRKFYRLSSSKVPFFFIASDEFIRLNPHFKEAVEQLKKNKETAVSSANLFHTVLGIFGIRSPYYDEELELSSSKLRPYTGPHPDRNGHAADGKIWY